MEHQRQVTVYRSTENGLLSYRHEDGMSFPLPVIQDNLFKLKDKVTHNETDYKIVPVQTNDGTFTYRLVSAPQMVSVGGGGGSRRAINVSDEGTALGIANTLNFVGAMVDVSLNSSTGVATITIGSGVFVGGGGTLNFIAKFTPDGTQIGDSQLYDNGTSIGFDTVTPVSVATFDIVSTTQGMLFPRMTTAQRDLIVTGATSNSLFIFNTTTRKFNYWDNTAAAWQSIDTHMGIGDVEGSGTTGQLPVWTDGPNSIIGDSGIVAANVYVQNGNSFGANAVIGTNDAFSFSFETSGATRGTISSGGLWGINRAVVAGTLLSVQGTGTTSATYIAEFFNSTPTSYFQFRDDGAFVLPVDGQDIIFNGGSRFEKTAGEDLTFRPAASGSFRGYNSGNTVVVLGYDDRTSTNAVAFAGQRNYDGNEAFAVSGNSTSTFIQKWFAGSGSFRACMTDGANFGIGTQTFGTSALNTIGIFKNVAPTTSPADMIQIFAVDTSTANTSLGLRTEQAVEAIGLSVADSKLRVLINGTEYFILLDTA